MVLDHTPFYAESGGQVGDRGELLASTAAGSSGKLRFRVDDTQKIQGNVFGHHGALLEGNLKLGDQLTARVDVAARAQIMRNHSATHLMHKALRNVLGDHVQQKGSLVDPEKTRFDFSHTAPLTDEQTREIERIVNREIFANAQTSAQVMAFDDAVRGGATALFGEKYGDSVRVLDIGTSRELCGGTHVQRTGDIGLFKIVSEGGVAAGIRRVEAVTGERALDNIQEAAQTINGVAAAMKTVPAEIGSRIAQLLEHSKSLEKELSRIKSKMAAAQGGDLSTQAVDVKGVKVVAAVLEGADVKTLRETMDGLKDKLKHAAIVLAAVDGEKVSLVAGITSALMAQIKAGDLVNHVATQVGGKGGGRADSAQAGGNNPAGLPAALASVAGWVEARVKV